MTEQFDAKHRQILNTLQKDARVPFSRINAKLGIGEAIVRYRVKQLEAQSVIKK